MHRILPMVCLLPLPLATAAEPTPEEAHALATIQKLGGRATLDPQLDPPGRIAARFDRPTDATLLALKKLAPLGAVELLEAGAVTAKGLAALQELPHLRRLVIERGKLSAAALAAIGRCEHLRHLGLPDCGLTDAGLGSLKPLTLLETLSLTDNPAITDKGLAVVKGFERLQVLSLAKTAITDKGLAELRSLDGLRKLDVRGSRVTLDAAEKFPDGMPNLRKVLW